MKVLRSRAADHFISPKFARIKGGDLFDEILNWVQSIRNADITLFTSFWKRSKNFVHLHSFNKISNILTDNIITINPI